MNGKSTVVERITAEDIETFNMSRLLLMLKVAETATKAGGLSLERLVYFEFFSSHPYLVFKKGDPEWRDLITSGHGLRTLGYSSPAHRFVSRRERAKRYIAGLVARGLVRVDIREGQLLLTITEQGKVGVNQLSSLYGMAMELSARLILKKLNPLSDKALTEQARNWLGGGLILLDLGE